MVLAGVVGCAGGYALWTTTRPTPSTEVAKTPQAAQSKPTIQPSIVNADTSQFQKLKGKWVRPDGGYLLEVSSVNEKGLVEATYLNPKPIEVAKAEASQEGTNTKMHIVLSGTNYLGSTYDLTYDPEGDQLTGVYFQAKLQQRFEVTFVRTGEE